jgi:hypothetical protein
MPLTLRRAQAFVKLNGPEVDDFDVFVDTTRIGRVFRKDRDAPWYWSIFTSVAPRRISSYAPTRALAVRMLADTYDAVKAADDAVKAADPSVDICPAPPAFTH